MPSFLVLLRCQYSTALAWIHWLNSLLLLNQAIARIHGRENGGNKSKSGVRKRRVKRSRGRVTNVKGSEGRWKRIEERKGRKKRERDTEEKTYRFQLITFTSVSLARMPICDFLTRTSHIRTVPSAEQLANTLFSLGDHCRSSTEDVWPTKGVSSVTKEDEGVRDVRNILLSVPPVRSLPA